MTNLHPASQTAQGLHKISLAMRHHAWSACADQGMSPTQAQALVALRNADGPLRLAELAEALSIKPATASEAVSSLEGKGLITKAPDEDDRRAVAIRLTEAGSRQADLVTLWPDVMLDAIGSLDRTEQAVMRRALVKMIGTLQSRGLIPPARMCLNCTHFQPNAHAGTDQPHHCRFIDAPIGDTELRIDCDDMDLIEPTASARLMRAFVNGLPIDSGERDVSAPPTTPDPQQENA